MTKQRMQVLRTIDKFGKIGPDGVRELLQKPLAEFGAELDPVRAEFIVRLLTPAQPGGSNQEILRGIAELTSHAQLVGSRLMAALEKTIVAESGETAWDRLLAMPPNEDNSWSDGGRPQNIGWALDDLRNEKEDGRG